MHTPTRKIDLIILAALYWLAKPFVEAIYYSTELSRGAYPVNADAIAIPIFYFSIGWLMLSPFAALFIWWALGSYPGSVPLLAFNHKRKVLGGLFWVLTIAFLIESLFFGFKSIVSAHGIDAIDQLFSCYLALCFNGVVQAKVRHTSSSDKLPPQTAEEMP